MSTRDSRSGGAARAARIECTVDTDPRLIAAVGPIVANAAERAELPQSVSADLAAAAVEACRRMFPHSGTGGKTANAIRVEVTDFSDRVEVAIQGADTSTPAGKSMDGFHRPLQDLKVERTRCEVGDGRVRLTLIKQCGEAKSSQTA